MKKDTHEKFLEKVDRSQTGINDVLGKDEHPCTSHFKASFLILRMLFFQKLWLIPKVWLRLVHFGTWVRTRHAIDYQCITWAGFSIHRQMGISYYLIRIRKNLLFLILFSTFTLWLCCHGKTSKITYFFSCYCNWKISH